MLHVLVDWTHVAPPLLQVARAGRFGTKGLAITFVSDETDAKTLNDVQDRFEVNVAELPDEIDISSYSKSLLLLMLTGFSEAGPIVMCGIKSRNSRQHKTQRCSINWNRNSAKYVYKYAE